jgi:hypothetical protein
MPWGTAPGQGAGRITARTGDGCDSVCAMSDDIRMSEEIRRELLAEKELAQNLAESHGRLAPRCPECDAIGTLEEIDGVLRCIDCDEVVAQKTKLAGFGRR